MPQDAATILAAAALVLAALAFVVALAALVRTGRSLKRRARATAVDATLEETVAAGLERIGSLERQVVQLGERGRGALQRVGVVRFNPFEDTGGNQSFAVALLDDRGDGVVMSSLHSRQSTRVYLKPISGGRSETALSDEESEALRRAGAD
ncbi:MAG TPA: DUF4446 family protein [Candidatus Limnocylindrales bacterium]|nr:DUF4446 family protein [Candidatus Limnocylindrales bacterium]